MTFACSVVIPSHNRAEQLDDLLAALARQDTTEPFEVIVVLDGSADHSFEVMERWEKRASFSGLRWVEQSRKGQATARNVGAFLARAPVLLFLDDDVVPDTDVISIHLGHHRTGERIVVLGDCEVVRSQKSSFCEIDWWGWWEDTYHRRASAGQPVSYRDFLTGHVSLRRDDFARLGGFDPDFVGYGGEDYELGYRLLRSGVRFVVDRRAHALHYTEMSVKRMMRIARQSGPGDVLNARKHHEIMPGLPLASAGRGARRLAAGLAMYLPWVAPIASLMLRSFLRGLEFVKLRGRWLKLYGVAGWYSYWLGVRDATGSMQELRKLRVAPLRTPTQSIDLAIELGPQVQRLDVNVPSRVVVAYEGRTIGSLDLYPGLSEPLLPWIIREITERLGSELLFEFERGPKQGNPNQMDQGTQIFRAV